MAARREVEYSNSAPAGSQPNWHHVRARVYIPAPDGAAGTVELTPAANNTVTELANVFHYDHLGSVECISPYPAPPPPYSVDHAGKTTRYGYDAWGQRRNPVTMSGPPTSATSAGGHTDLTMRGFTGHEMLDDIGLVHMNGRIYDPLLGRFLSADVVVQNPLSLQSFNRYSYVLNNPLSLTDPSGFQSTGVAPDPVTAEEMAQAVKMLYDETPPQYWPLITVSLPFMLIKGDAGPHQTFPLANPKPPAPSTPPRPGPPDPSKPPQPTPHEVKIDPNSIQANQGDAVKTNQSPPQEQKPDAPKEAPKDTPKKDDAKDSKKSASDSPKLVSNPKHNPNSASPEPSNVADLFSRSIVDKNGVRWAVSDDGTIHRFSKPSNGETHWNGSTAGDKPIEQQNIPNDVKKQLEEQLDKLKEKKT